jgi:hypothetical protein
VTAPHEPLINTGLQAGAAPTARSESRFNGFSPLPAQTMTLD